MSSRRRFHSFRFLSARSMKKGEREICSDRNINDRGDEFGQRLDQREQFYPKSRRGTRLELICLRGRKKVSERRKKNEEQNRVAASPTLTGIKNQGCPVSKVTRQISNVVSPRKERVESRRNLRTLGDNFNSPLPPAFLSVSLSLHPVAIVVVAKLPLLFVARQGCA